MEALLELPLLEPGRTYQVGIEEKGKHASLRLNEFDNEKSSLLKRSFIVPTTNTSTGTETKVAGEDEILVPLLGQIALLNDLGQEKTTGKWFKLQSWLAFQFAKANLSTFMKRESTRNFLSALWTNLQRRFIHSITVEHFAEMINVASDNVFSMTSMRTVIESTFSLKQAQLQNAGDLLRKILASTEGMIGVYITREPSVEWGAALSTNAMNDFLYDQIDSHPYATDDIIHVDNDVILDRWVAQFDMLQQLLVLQGKLDGPVIDGKFSPSTSSYEYAMAPLTLPTLSYFDGVRLSSKINFISVTDKAGRLYSKIWRLGGPSVDPRHLRSVQTMIIRMQVGDLPKVDREIKVDLAKQLVTFTAKSANVEEIVGQLRQLGLVESKSLPRQLNISGELQFSRIGGLDRWSFMNYLLTDADAYNFLRLQETRGSNFFRDQVSLKYYTLSSIIEGAERWFQSKGLLTTLRWQDGALLTFHIRRIPNEQTVRMVQRVIGRILYLFKQQESSLKAMFASLVKAPTELMPVDNMEVLQRAMPDLFGTSYVKRFRSAARRPAVINDVKEAGTRRVTRIIWRGRELLLVPSSPTHPHFGLDVNDRYPDMPGAVPAYFKEEQTGGGTNTIFNRLAYGFVSQRAGRLRLDSSTDTNSLGYMGMGSLPATLNKFFYSQLGLNIKRMGLGQDSNTFLRGVIVGCDWKTYIRPDFLVQLRERESDGGLSSLNKDADAFRRYCYGKLDSMDNGGISTALARQELYASSPIDIKSNFTKGSMINHAHHRIIEAALKGFRHHYSEVHIFVFRLESNSTEVNMVLPPHADYYMPAVPDFTRPCILFYQHGDEFDLIIHGHGNLPEYSGFFHPQYTPFLWDMFRRLYRVDAILPSVNSVNSDFNYVPRESKQLAPGERSDLPILEYGFLGSIGTPESQILDTRGKCIALNMKLLMDSRVRFTVYIDARAPFNLPEVSTRILVNYKYFQQAPFVPTAYNGEGIWFRAYDLDLGFFICMHPDDVKAFVSGLALPAGPHPPPLTNTRPELGLGQRTQVLQRQATLLKETLQWVYEQSNLDPKAFVSQYTMEAKTPHVNYDFGRVDPNLPAVTSAEDALRYLALNTKGLIFENSTIPEAKRSTSLSVGFVFMLSAAVRAKLPEYLQNLPSERRIYKLSSSYQTTAGFKPQENVIIMVGMDRYKRWYSAEAVSTSHVIPGMTELSPDNFPAECVLQNPAGIYYMTPLGKTIDDAVAEGRAWKESRMGYAVYQSHTNGTLELIENQTGGQVPYLELYRHRDQPLVSLMVRIG